MQVKKEEKKKAILRAARDLIYERGIEGMSMGDVAKLARVGKGTIYVYFSSKDELIRAVARDVYRSFSEDIREALEKSGSLPEFLNALTENILRDLKIRGRLLYILHRYFRQHEEDYISFHEEYERSIGEIHNKFGNETDLDMDEMKFFITSFVMSTYIFSRDLDEEKLKSILKKGLRKIFLSR